MRKAVIPLALMVLATAGCVKSGDSSPTKPVLAVSIEPQRAVLAEIAGSGYDIVTLLPGGADPESFDPSVNLRRQAADAEIYFATGAFPFEQTFAEAAGEKASLATDAVDLIYGTHDHGHGHDEGEECEGHHGHGAPDPHIWTSPANLRAMAREMTGKLSALKPDSAGIYRQRSDIFENRLDSLDAYIRPRISGKAFAVWHPSLSYLARDYGMHQHAMGLEGREMSARQVRQVIDGARADSVRVFFVESASEATRARAIADGIGARVVQINLLAPDWENQLRTIADELARP